MNRFIFTFILAMTLISVNSFAQEMAVATIPAPAKAEAVEPTTTGQPEEAVEETEEKPFEISGFVDAYYQYGFQKTPFITSFTPDHNSFALGMANVVLKKEGKVGFVADLAFGPRAEGANGYAGENGLNQLSLIKQLFVTYAPSEKVTFTLGNFSTFVGYEVIDAPGNINYSTSYMFTNGPFYHTGLKMDFAASENFGIMVGVFNDTDTKIDEVPGKHFGAQLSFSTGGLSAYLNYLGGKVAEADEITGDQFLHQVDLTATYDVSDVFGLGLNVTNRSWAVDKGDGFGWSGAALYAKYAISDAFTLGLRGEQIFDQDGVILGVPDNSITALTLSGNIHIGNLTLIPEFRADLGKKDDSYLDGDGNGVKSLTGFIFGAYYAF